MTKTLCERGYVLIVEDDEGEVEYPNVEDFGMNGTGGLMVKYEDGQRDIFDHYHRLELYKPHKVSSDA